MKPLYKVAALLLCSIQVLAQSTIKGKVTDESSRPVPYATILLKVSKDGAITDEAGNFTITTQAKGLDTLAVNAMGYDEYLYDIELADKNYDLKLTMPDPPTDLGEVLITAGSIEANNERSVAVLTPLDIVSTAGGQGDIIGAIQTLPGVQRNGGDQTGLMVRGGDVNESAVIVDGTIAQNAFFSTVPGVAQRSRFNPFQFKGVSFSSGGYTARYGQALSSILDLQTSDLPEKSTASLGLNFAGVSVSGVKLMENNAIEFTGNYTDLSPFYELTKPNVQYKRVPKGGSISTRWVSKIGEKGMFKMNFQHRFNKMALVIPDPTTAGQTIPFGIENDNTSFNSSFKKWVNTNLNVFTAFAFSNNTDNLTWGKIPSYRNDTRVQGRAEVQYFPKSRVEILAGVEAQKYGYTQKYDTLALGFNEVLLALYAESEWKPLKRLALKLGGRAEHSQYLGKGSIVPRFSSAYKTGKHSQISMATGIFYQNAAPQYLMQGYKPGLQRAIHYMANYQWIKSDRTFRIETYYKSYDQLIKENKPYTPNAFRFDYGIVTNAGSGYAQGIDLFWRDKKSIKSFDYWVSYSFIDTKRLYQNYPTKVRPDYVSPHNLNLITKYFVEKWQTSISLSYNYASGRGYYNPSTEFLSQTAPDYHNFSIGMAYLTTVKKVFTVIYLSVDNVTNHKNVLGYRYSADGASRYPILPPMYRSIFFGINMSLSKFDKDEL